MSLDIGTIFKVKKGGEYFDRVFVVVDKRTLHFYCVALSRGRTVDKRHKFRTSTFSDIPHHVHFPHKEFWDSEHIEILGTMDIETIPEISNRDRNSRWVKWYG